MWRDVTLLCIVGHWHHLWGNTNVNEQMGKTNKKKQRKKRRRTSSVTSTPHSLLSQICFQHMALIVCSLFSHFYKTIPCVAYQRSHSNPNLPIVLNHIQHILNWGFWALMSHRLIITTLRNYSGDAAIVSDGKTRLREPLRLSSPMVHQKVHYLKPDTCCAKGCMTD